MNFRVGIGYDVHKLVDGRALILGGVNIPYELGLLGHSDADVLIHAIIDALLGAMGQGDIGMLFPDNDCSYKDISSLVLLDMVKKLMDEKKYTVVNIDSIIIAQKPKLSKYFENMKLNIAKALCVSVDLVNIKATTEEGLGFTGNLEGMSAKAVCLILKNN